MPRILAACGGFLVAVLWMDLMFDVQVLAADPHTEVLPEATLASIAGYYRRVTTDATPMQFLIGIVMFTTVGGSIAQLVRGAGPRWLAALALALGATPVALAALRVLPNAVALGARGDSLARQSELARAICTDHLFCLAAIVGFVSIQLAATRPGRSAASERPV